MAAVGAYKHSPRLIVRVSFVTAAYCTARVCLGMCHLLIQQSMQLSGLVVADCQCVQ